MNDNKLLIPSKEQILSWIRTICDMGYKPIIGNDIFNLIRKNSIYSFMLKNIL